MFASGRNQARIDCKSFATNQTGVNACLDDPFEHAAENISIAEAVVAGARERRMIRDSVPDTVLAELAIGEVHLHFTADQPFRAHRKDIPTTSIRIISSGSIDRRLIDE